MSLLIILLDGVGLGVAEPAINPLMAARTPTLSALLGGPLTRELPAVSRQQLVFRGIDARLGVSGLPQSATGQASLLTGCNAAQLMGRHYGPYPGPTLRRLIEGGTLLDVPGAQLANAYPPAFFSALAAGKLRLNVPALAAQRAGLRLRTLEDYRNGNGISADLTGARLHPAAPPLSPQAMGARLAELSRNAPLTLFDLWLTDHLGHRGSFAEAVAFIEQLDAFLAGVIEQLAELTLLVTADHGNLEDKSTKSHTTAAVPLLAIGPKAHAFAEVAALTDIAPAVQRALPAGVADSRHRPLAEDLPGELVDRLGLEPLP